MAYLRPHPNPIDMPAEPQSKIDEALEQLLKACRETGPDHVVSLYVAINSEGMRTEWDARDPEGLKAAGVSMRNLRGEFIK